MIALALMMLTLAADRPASLDEQNKCSEQARKRFKDLGYKLDEGYSFGSHFSPKLGKCFISVRRSSHGKFVGVQREVMDAYSGKGWSFYLWFMSEGLDAPPKTCWVGTSQSGCRSEDEYNALLEKTIGSSFD